MMEVFHFRPQKPLTFALVTVLKLGKSAKKYECGLNIPLVFKEPEVFMIITLHQIRKNFTCMTSSWSGIMHKKYMDGKHTTPTANIVPVTQFLSNKQWTTLQAIYPWFAWNNPSSLVPNYPCILLIGRLEAKKQLLPKNSYCMTSFISPIAPANFAPKKQLGNHAMFRP